MPGRSRRKKDKLLRYSLIAPIIMAIFAGITLSLDAIKLFFSPKAEVAINNPPIQETIDISEMRRLEESKKEAEIDNAIKEFIENTSLNDSNLDQNSVSYDVERIPEELAKKMDYSSEYGYLAQILVTNNEDNDIMISQISFNADHITRLNKPHLFLYVMATNEKVWIEIWNDGWGNARNLKIKIVGEEPENYKKLFGKEQFSIQIDKLDYTQSCEKTLFTLSDVVSGSSNLQLNIAPIIYIVYEDEDNNEYTMKDEDNYLYFNYGSFFTAGGGESEAVYTVEVNTEKTKYSASLKTTEVIKPNEMLQIPFYIFVDQSCNLDFSMSLDIISGKSKYTIESKQENINVNASSRK